MPGLRKLMLCSFLLAAPARGELLVCSFSQSLVYRYDATNGSFIDLVVTNGEGSLSVPHGVLFGPDNHLYVTSSDNDRIVRFNGYTGEFVDEFVVAGSGGLDYPVGMAFGRDGNLYVNSQVNDRVLRFNGITGAFIDTFVTNASGGLDGPSDFVFGPDGDIYITGRYSDRVYVYSGTNGAFLRFAATNNLSQPFGLAFGPDGSLFVSSGNTGQIQRFDPTNATFLGTFATGLGFPVDILFGPDGHLYVADFGGNRVAKFNGITGALITNFVAVGSGGIAGPNFMTFRPPSVAPSPGAVIFRANAPGAHDYGRQMRLPPGFGSGEFTLQLWLRPDTTYPIGPVPYPDGSQLTNWFDGDPQPYSSGDWWFSGNFLLDGHNNSSFQDGTFSLQLYGAGRVRWDFGDGVNAGPGSHLAVQAWPATNTFSLLDSAWHRVSCVRRWVNTNDALLELWVDGQFVASQTSNVRTDMTTYWTNWSGYPAGQAGWFWGAEKQAAIGAGINQYEDYKGLVDELLFWNRALSTAELADVLSPVTGAESGLVGWFSFREGQSGVARDALDPARTIVFSNVTSNAWSRQNAPLDEDADALADWWELVHFGSTTSAAPQVDSDGDGMGHLGEYEAGTDPTNAASVFQWLEVSPLRFPTIGGRRYRLDVSTSPVGTWNEVVAAWSNETEQGVAFDQPSVRTLVMPAPASNAIYRVRRIVEGP